MVALNQRFRVDDPELQGGGPVLIDKGQYKAIFVNSEMKENKKKTGHFIEMKAVITEGRYMNTELIERLNVINPNQIAVKIAYQTLAKISSALGMHETPADTSELHGKPLIITVETDPGQAYEKTDPVTGEVKTFPGNDASFIKDYSAVPSVGGFAAQATVMQSLPTQAAAQPQPGFAQPAATPLWTPPGAQ